MNWFWPVLGLIVIYLLVSYFRRRAGSNGLGTYENLRELMESGGRPFTLVDVRTPEEYRSGHIPGAINIPHDRIGAKPPKADRTALIVLYCHTGSRSVFARAALKQKGFTEVSNFGRIGKWKGPVVEGGKPGSLNGKG